MARRRTRTSPRDHWPPALRHVLRAADAECPRGHARALRELTALALRKVPSRGLFDPSIRGEHDLFAAIESIADAHLGFADARASTRKALDAAKIDLQRRDDIERAALHVQTISDSAYFYAGLAFGLAALAPYKNG